MTAMVEIGPRGAIECLDLSVGGLIVASMYYLLRPCRSTLWSDMPDLRRRGLDLAKLNWDALEWREAERPFDETTLQFAFRFGIATRQGLVISGSEPCAVDTPGTADEHSDAPAERPARTGSHRADHAGICGAERRARRPYRSHHESGA